MHGQNHIKFNNIYFIIDLFRLISLNVLWQHLEIPRNYATPNMV